MTPDSSRVRVRLLATLAGVLALLLLLMPTAAAQTLSSQVLQLLARANAWTGQQTFYDLRLIRQTPADTTDRLYSINGGLYWNGAAIVVPGGGVGLHALLSSTHSDTTAAVPTRGAVITGQGASATWSRLTIGAAGTVLRSDGTDVAWSTSGSGLTALNASALTAGTVPLARLDGITNTQIDPTAAIAWTKIDPTGSSLADLTTRSATDLSSGTLADARLSANVSLLGAAIDTAEITNSTILFADWASNSCTSGQYPQYNGSSWICGTVTPGAGTVTSVALTVPPVMSVAGSPITGSGTLAVTLATQAANLVWAGPSSGAAAAPTFRSLGYTDLPTSAAAAGTYPKVTINAQGIVTGTSTTIALATDVAGTLAFANGGTNLNAAADDSLLLSTGTAWAAVAVPNCTSGLSYTAASNTFGCSSSGAAHALLSATHTDTVAAAVVRGDLIVGTSTPQWARLALGANQTVLRSNGTDPVWSDSLIIGETSGWTLTVDPSTPTGSYVVSADGPSSQFVRFGPTIATSTAPKLSIAANATPALNTSGYGLQISSNLITAASGVHVIMAGTRFAAGTATSAGANVSYAANVLVDGAPSPNITLSGNYGLWVRNSSTQLSQGFYEWDRAVKAGSWATPTFAAGDYTSSAGSWTVAAGDVGAAGTTLIGKTLTYSGYLATSTVAGTPGELRITMPGGVTWARTCNGSFSYLDNGTAGTGVWRANSGNAYITLFKDLNAVAWANATDTTYIAVTAVCEIN